MSQVNLAQQKGIQDPDWPGLISTAEAATLQLEFKYLAYLTDEDIYWEKAEWVMEVIKLARMPHGLASVFMRYVKNRGITLHCLLLRFHFLMPTITGQTLLFPKEPLMSQRRHYDITDL